MRSLIVIITNFTGGFIAVIWLFITEAFRKVDRDAENAVQFRQLR